MEGQAELTAHITTGAAIVYLIQWMKHAGLTPWLTAETKTLNRIASATLAAVAAVGINWTYNAAVDGGTLVITGLSASAILTGGWEWFRQFTMQQLIFDGVVQKAGNAKGGS